MADETKPRKISVLDKAIDYLKSCTNLGKLDDQVVAGLSAVLEYWDCDTNKWEFLACASDFEDPSDEFEMFDITGAACERDEDGNFYGERMPSPRSDLGDVDFEIYLTRKKWNKLRSMRRTKTAYRVIDKNQDFVAYNAYISSLARSFPGDAEAAMLNFTLAPTGAPYVGTAV